jgi:hypothetical protein
VQDEAVLQRLTLGLKEFVELLPQLVLEAAMALEKQYFVVCLKSLDS